jgi:hypothetical protein
MAITAEIGHGIHYVSDIRRNGTRARMAIESAIKASEGLMIVFIHPFFQINHCSALRKFLHALHLMSSTDPLLGYESYLSNNESTLKKAGPPVTVITNSSSVVPLWLTGLHSPRQFILVDSEDDGDPTPVLSKFPYEGGWRIFARTLEDLEVKKIILYGERSDACIAVAFTGLAKYFDTYYDGIHVFPQEKPGLHRELRADLPKSKNTGTRFFPFVITDS